MEPPSEPPLSGGLSLLVEPTRASPTSPRTPGGADAPDASLYVPSRGASDGFAKPSPVRSQVTRRRAGFVRPAKGEPVPFEQLLQAQLVRAGDTLLLLGLEARVMRDGWLELEHEKQLLPGFVAAALRKASPGLTHELRAELKHGGRAAYELIQVERCGCSLWALSEAYDNGQLRVGVAESPSLPMYSSDDESHHPPQKGPDPEDSSSSSSSSSGDAIRGVPFDLDPQVEEEEDAAAAPLSLVDMDLVSEEKEEAPLAPTLPSPGALVATTQLPVSPVRGGDLLDAIRASETSTWKRVPRRPFASGSTQQQQPQDVSAGGTASMQKKRARTQPPASRDVIVIADEEAARSPLAVTPVGRPRAASKRARGAPASPEDSLAPEVAAVVRGLARHQEVLENAERRRQVDAAESAEQHPRSGLSTALLGGGPLQVPPRVLLCSGLRVPQLEQVRHVCATLRGIPVQAWRVDVTHVVMFVDAHGTCKRTIKYIQGVLAGCFVVTHEWVAACAAARAWVDERPYLVQHDSSGGHGAPAAMLERLSAGQGRLFAGLAVFVYGSFAACAFSVAELEQCAEAGGATVMRVAPDADTPVVVLCSDALLGTEAERVWTDTGHDGVSFQWLFDCASRAQLLSKTDYQRTFFELDGAFVVATQNSPAL